MSPDQIIDGILDREGENGPDYLDAHDKGGRTSWGISERAHPEAWIDGPPSREAAAAIYRRIYVAPWEWVTYPPLRNQLIDCTVLHGQHRTAKLLQLVLGNVAVDGRLGPQTRYWTERGTERDHRLINNSLAAYRLRFIDALTDDDPSQKRFEEGWENRALRFVI